MNPWLVLISPFKQPLLLGANAPRRACFFPSICRVLIFDHFTCCSCWHVAHARLCSTGAVITFLTTLRLMAVPFSKSKQISAQVGATLQNEEQRLIQRESRAGLNATLESKCCYIDLHCKVLFWVFTWSWRPHKSTLNKHKWLSSIQWTYLYHLDRKILWIMFMFTLWLFNIAMEHHHF